MLIVGNLAFGGNCNFMVMLSILEGILGGVYMNMILLLFFIINGEIIFSVGVSDDFIIFFVFKIIKFFVEGVVFVGEMVMFEFMIDYMDEVIYNVINISFIDDLDVFFSGIVVLGLLFINLCGIGLVIMGIFNLELIGGELSFGGLCIFQVII